MNLNDDELDIVHDVIAIFLGNNTTKYLDEKARQIYWKIWEHKHERENIQTAERNVRTATLQQRPERGNQ